uniref:DEUBAD domain-containing protein n=1 Tax=Timema douglasi TaxID=61478 RepID=A0A7R8VLM5_TIMDO|nr:unnamed protein product [Timema douglasi]
MDVEYSMSSNASTSGSDVSQESTTKFEEFCAEGVRIQLPQDLCENKDIFKEFFSMQTWQEGFSEEDKQHLKQFLPTFEENDDEEKEKTIEQFFSYEKMGFGSPLEDYFVKLKNGYFRPDISRLRCLMKKAHIRAYRYQRRRHLTHLLKDVLMSRQQHLEAVKNQPPGRLERLPQHPVPPQTKSSIEQRVRRRYFQELEAIRQEVGESDQSSEDENYPEGPPQRLSKKQKRQLVTLECSLSPELHRVTSTKSSKPSGFDLEANITTNFNPYDTNEDGYRSMLVNHKRRKIQGENNAELNTDSITLEEVELRTHMGKQRPIFSKNGQHVSEMKPSAKKKAVNSKSAAMAQALQLRLSIASPQVCGGDSSNNSDIGESEEEEPLTSMMDDMDGIDVDVETTSTTKTTPAPRNKRTSSVSSVRSGKTNIAASRNIMQRHVDSMVEIEEQSPVVVVASQPSTTPSSRQVTAATLSDLDGIDMMNLPIDMEEDDEDQEIDTKSVDLDIKPGPELMQETHACFFSLVRDVICSTPDHRMSLSTLEDRLKAWQENPISPLNDWYCIAADSWLLMLPSAISFLSGDYPDAQPDDFVPYLEYKPHLVAYQWIGAGRDTDTHLMPLCQHWLDHREEMLVRPIKEEEGVEEVGEGEERACSPPPPRYPTTWSVRSTSSEEKELFREQERLRYEHPHRAFTFRMHGYESVVGPVKGVYNQSVGANKPRGHSLLVADRPNFVTILALVRDSTARLPNGEGTRSDICELLKDSQYLAPISQESYLHSVVSGALDRLHYEADPCVKYDTKRKIWIYLHRGRTEEEFERVHQQQQGMAKSKKNTSQRKTSRSKQQQKESTAAAASMKEILQPAPTISSTKVKIEVSVASSPTITPTPAAVTVASSASTQKVGRTTTARPLTLTGHTIQNLQVSTSSGVQTIQVTTSSGLLGGNSLLTSSATSGTSHTKTVAASGLVSQQVQTVAGTARTVRTSVGSNSSSQLEASPAGSLLTTPIHQKVSVSAAQTLATSKAAAQLLSMSQVQLMSSRSPQHSGSTVPILAASKTLVTGGLSSMKLVNAVKAISSNDAIFIKQGQQVVTTTTAVGGTISQQQLHKLGEGGGVVTQHQQLLQQQAKVQCAFLGAQGVSLPQMTVSPQQLQQSLATPVSGATNATLIKQQQQGPLVAKVLTNAQGQVISMESLLAHQKQHGTLPQGTALRVTTAGKPGQTSLIQIPSTTPGGVPQFAVVSQGNLLSVGQPRVLHTQLATQVLARSGIDTGHYVTARTSCLVYSYIDTLDHGTTEAGPLKEPTCLIKCISSPQSALQQQTTKLVNTLTGKPMMASMGAATAANLRMLSPQGTATGINLAHIGGKPVLLASKAQPTSLQGGPGQNVILTSQAAGGHQTVVLAASQAIRSQGGALVLQQGATQQILLPPGFQGGTLNIKSLQGLQGLQGLKVIPLSQATAAAAGKGRQQVYARIISPNLRPVTPGATVTLQAAPTETPIVTPTPSTSTNQ